MNCWNSSSERSMKVALWEIYLNKLAELRLAGKWHQDANNSSQTGNPHFMKCCTKARCSCSELLSSKSTSKSQSVFEVLISVLFNFAPPASVLYVELDYLHLTPVLCQMDGHEILLRKVIYVENNQTLFVKLNKAVPHFPDSVCSISGSWGLVHPLDRPLAVCHACPWDGAQAAPCSPLTLQIRGKSFKSHHANLRELAHNQLMTFSGLNSPAGCAWLY